MTRPVAILRPEPGAAATAVRAETLGLTVIRLPLFEVRALGWRPPSIAGFDSLLLTSANAVRCAGPELAGYVALPVLAVGKATALAADEAGLNVALIGHENVAALLKAAIGQGFTRALHLGGRETSLPAKSIVVKSMIVYASEVTEIAPDAAAALAGSVALLHSARAARRLAALLVEAGVARASLRIAALSPAIAAAAGAGWDAVAVPPTVGDTALLQVARTLADAERIPD